MMKNDYTFDWAELAFSSKKPVKDLNAIFVTAPRELSKKRFTQLVKKYLPKSNLLIGISVEPYVLGLHDQPQFKMLSFNDIQPIVDQVFKSASKHKIYILNYSQRDVAYILEKLKPSKVLLVNGSWYHSFHHRPEYYTLVNNKIHIEKISPFCDEQEAIKYVSQTKLLSLPKKGTFNDKGMMDLADLAAKHSYDFGGLQTGVSLGIKKTQKYELIGLAHNEILPYETYSMHHGSIREKHFSPMHDLNYYDTVHAEVLAVIDALKNGNRHKGTSLFINLLPCPTCTKMLMKTDISEIVYREDHSDGYAIKMLEQMGKKVRRLVI
jgi:deoxycytidylate deaminase